MTATFAAKMRHAAGEGCDGEHAHAEQEDQSATELIRRGAADQEQRGLAEGVGVDHPLHSRQRCREILLHGRQREIDDRLIDVSHGRGAHRRREYPGLPATGASATGLNS